MISENQEVESLKQELIDINKHIGSVEQKISFRGKGRAGKWTAILIKAKARRTEIRVDISHENNKTTAEETKAFLKKYDEKERIKKEEAELVKEKEEAFALFKKYKENPIPISVKEQKEMPNFDYIGIRIREIHQKDLKQAQNQFDSAKQKSENRSPAGKGNRAGEVQRARNELDMVLKGVKNEPILIEYRELRAEKEWKETIIKELEAEIDERQVGIDKIKKDFALIEKHLKYIKTKNKT